MVMFKNSTKQTPHKIIPTLQAALFQLHTFVASILPILGWSSLLSLMCPSCSLESRFSGPDFVSQLWRKIRGKAWTDFSRDTVAPWRQSTIRESNPSHGMFFLCTTESLRCESQNQVQGDRVTWRVGSLFTSSRLDILVATVLPKHWRLCMRATKKPYIRSALINSWATWKYILWCYNWFYNV